MIYVYKQFGYGKPKLKDEYKEAIYTTNRDYPEFKELIAKLTTAEFAQKMSSLVKTLLLYWQMLQF